VNKEYQYSNIDLVKIAYIEMVIARGQMNTMNKIASSPLPRKVYHTRKSHERADWLAAKSDKPRKTKQIAMFDAMLKRQQRFMKAEANLNELASKLTKEEKTAISKGINLPVNVMASPQKSILGEINTSQNKDLALADTKVSTRSSKQSKSQK